MTTAELNWESPDGGEWFFEAAHFPHTVSRLFADIIDVICEGWVTGAKRWGTERGRARWAYINGYVYYGQRGEGSAGDPELAALAVNERWWVEDARRWFEEEKPRVVATNRALQAVDVEKLDDAGLVAHTKDVLAHLLQSAPLHFSHEGRNVVLGQLRAKAEADGVDAAAINAALAGGSPATSRPGALIGRIAHALRAAAVDPSGVQSLEAVRSIPAAATALENYLEEYGHRLLDSYDLACPTLGERPNIVLTSIRAAATARPERREAALPDISDELRELLDQARVSYGIEDDDDGVCIFWPSGLLRRALLELARRRGLSDASHIFEVDLAELQELLAGRGPDPEVLAARATARAAADLVIPPAKLGGDGEQAPESSASTGGELKGEGVGSGVVRGRACVVRRADDALARIQPGDVLIAVTTNPGYNTVMPIIAAVATETRMGHTVICAREFGIPAVIGIPGLTDAITDGATVEVDAAAGIVRIVS